MKIVSQFRPALNSRVGRHFGLRGIEIFVTVDRIVDELCLNAFRIRCQDAIAEGVVLMRDRDRITGGEGTADPAFDRIP